MFIKVVRFAPATGAMSVNQLSFLPTVNGIFRKSNILENIHFHKKNMNDVIICPKGKDRSPDSNVRDLHYIYTMISEFD